jgi:hypothetical protein
MYSSTRELPDAISVVKPYRGSFSPLQDRLFTTRLSATLSEATTLRFVQDDTPMIHNLHAK